MSNHNPVSHNQSYRALASGNNSSANQSACTPAYGIPGTNPDVRRDIQRSYFSAIEALRDVFYAQAQGRHLKTDHVKSFIQILIDQIPDYEEVYIALTSLKGFGDYLFQHSVNVSILSVALGFRLGLSGDRLSELAFAAIFHDFGKSTMFANNKSDSEARSRAELEIMETHTVLGAKYIARNSMLDRFSGNAMIVAFEHHKNRDGSGFPAVNKNRSLGLYSRIVAICNYYDEYTTGMSVKKAEVLIDQVFLKMIQQCYAKFDPSLMKAFFHLVGIYPIGTLLLLDSSELALVIQTNPENLFRPSVLIIADEKGRKNPAILAGLSAYDKSSNRFFRNIRHIVDPVKYGVDISEFMLID